MNTTEKEIMRKYSLNELCQMVEEFDNFSDAKIRTLSQKIFGKDNFINLMGCMILLAEELKDRIKELGGIK